MLKDRISDARRYRGKTQSELAEKLGVHQANVSAYELGNRNPKAETLQRIAASLDLVLHNIHGEAYFRDMHLDETMPEEDYAEGQTFNDEQEASAIYDAMQRGYSDPRKDGFWMEDPDAIQHKRDLDINRIKSNIKKLNDNGVEELAKHSDLLADSEKYTR